MTERERNKSLVQFVCLFKVNSSPRIFFRLHYPRLSDEERDKRSCTTPIEKHWKKTKTETKRMGILKGKETALEHIEKSKLAFLATLSEGEQGPSTHTMPPKDHFTLKFDRETLKNLKGRVYENMKQYTYEQRGQSLFLSHVDLCLISICCR